MRFAAPPKDMEEQIRLWITKNVKENSRLEFKLRIDLITPGLLRRATNGRARTIKICFHSGRKNQPDWLEKPVDFRHDKIHYRVQTIGCGIADVGDSRPPKLTRTFSLPCWQKCTHSASIPMQPDLHRGEPAGEISSALS